MKVKMQESFTAINNDLLFVGLSTSIQDEFSLPKGDVYMVLCDEQGNIKDQYEHQNLPVNIAGVLMAQLFKNEGVPGVTHVAVGSGNNAWNPNNPPAPNRDSTQLESEIFRKPWTSTQYITDGETPVPSVSPTHRIDLVFSLGPGEGTGSIDELALFGGLGAGVPNSGTMVCILHRPVTNKLAGDTLNITWRLKFG